MRPMPFVSRTESGQLGAVNGEVCISGPMIIEGYVGNPTADANSFFRMGGMDWFRTGDMVRDDGLRQRSTTTNTDH